MRAPKDAVPGPVTLRITLESDAHPHSVPTDIPARLDPVPKR